MPQCYVTNCSNYYGKTKANGTVSYHMIPSAPSLATKWAKACTGKNQTPPRYMRVCSEHFSDDCYQRDLQHELLGLPLRKRLKLDAVPDMNLNLDNLINKSFDSAFNDLSFKIPMRSSIRIAKRESLGCLAELQSPKVKKTKANVKRIERDRFVRKIKYMRQLRLNFQRNEKANGIVSPKNHVHSLNKMHVMEDVREGCDTQQPSSPGHADQRTEINESNQSDDESKSKEIKSEEDEPLSKSNPSTPRPESSPKRKNQSDGETPTKKTRSSGDIQQEFFLRNKILNEFTGSIDMSNSEQIQTKTEELLSEIRSLTELAKEKEREWDEIIHLKKFKEELLMKLQRRKQVCLLSNGLEISETDHNGDQRFTMRKRQEFNRQKLMKSIQNSLEMNGHDAKNKQRPVRDVQSIIADYRQQHPETVPRRGRRIRSAMNGQNSISSSKGVLNFSSMALGSGSQVRQNLNTAGFDVNSDLGLILSAMESASNDLAAPSSTEPHETTSFKDILVQFAKLSQSDKQELLQNTMKAPPPYPEVTVHPVSTTTPPTNSLLHGILTKTPVKTENKSAFSPTLARLLTAPERSVASQQNQAQSVNNQKSNVSISDILTTNKGRNEITITPVGPETETESPKRKTNQAATDEEEAEDSVDRLVIDESGEIIDARADNNSDAGDEVPQCQGCNQKAAQFVCAGCGNQWYCSRECQVTAWDEHSDVCSG